MEKPLRENITQQLAEWGNLQYKLTQLAEINQIWQTQVNSELTQYTRIANWRDNTLIIEVDSAAWATRLRYLIPDLLADLRRIPALSQLSAIEWYIAAPEPLLRKTVKLSEVKLSKNNADLLAELAENIRDENLKISLQKLASNSK